MLIVALCSELRIETENKIFHYKYGLWKLTDKRKDGNTNTMNIIELLLREEICPSKSSARRMIMQNAIRINDEVVTKMDYQVDMSEDFVLKCGKNINKLIKSEEIK